MIFQLKGQEEPKYNISITAKVQKQTTFVNNLINYEMITHGAGRTRASTDASLLSMLMPNSFA